MPSQDRIEKVAENLSEEDAFALEKLLILQWGRKVDGGVLHNISEGGDQPPSQKGKKKSAETRAKMGEASRRRWADAEMRERMCSSMRQSAAKRDRSTYKPGQERIYHTKEELAAGRKRARAERMKRPGYREMINAKQRAAYRRRMAA